MGLRKCPKCELNYIKDDEKLCVVCKKLSKEETDLDELPTTCTECGDSPVVKGSDLCAICLREKRRQEKITEDDEQDTGIDIADTELDEIEVPLANDIPETELAEIHKELGDDVEPEEDIEEEEEADEEYDDFEEYYQNKDDDEDDDDDDEDDDDEWN